MSNGWTDDYFDRVYLRRWSLGPPGQEVHRNVDFLLGELAITEGQSLLDVACGQGRYSLAFASHGLQVIGLDRSEVLLKEARRLASQTGLEVRWVRGDMRSIPFSPAFDRAVLIDSFGFFDSEAENTAVIDQLAGAVLPRGRVAIAVVNGGRILDAFEPSAREARDGVVVTVDRELSPESRVMREKVSVEEGGRRFSSERRQRLYSISELTDAIEKSPLAVRSIHGDLAGSLFDEATSGKIVVVCEKSSADSHPGR